MTDKLKWQDVQTRTELAEELIGELETLLENLVPAIALAVKAFGIDNMGRVTGVQDVPWDIVFEMTQIEPAAWTTLHDGLVNKHLNGQGWAVTKSFTNGKHQNQRFAGYYLIVAPHNAAPAESVEETKT